MASATSSSSSKASDAFAKLRNGKAATTNPCSVADCTEPGNFRVQMVARESIPGKGQRDRARVSGPTLCEAHAASYMESIAPELREVERAATEA